MDNMLSDYPELKLSAFTKLKVINAFVGPATLGPQAVSPKPQKTNPADDIDAAVVEHKENKALNSFIPYTRLVIGYEQQRKEDVNEKVKSHRNAFIDFKKQQEAAFRNQWNLQQQKMILQMEQKEDQIMQALSQIDIDHSKEQEKFAQYYKELAEKRQKNIREIEEKQEKHRKINKIIDTVQKSQHDFNLIYTEVINILKNCNEELKPTIILYTKNLNLLPPQINDIVKRCAESDITEEDSIKCTELLSFAQTLRDEIKKTIDDFEKEKLRIVEEKKQAQIEAEKKLADFNANQEKIKEQVIPVTNVSTEANKTSRASFRTYCDLQLFLQNHEAGCRNLREDPNLERFRFKCKRAVNLPLNAISGSKPNIDKYNTLHNLLAGQPVKFVDEVIEPSKYPQGIAFSVNLLAQKFVRQGHLLITGNPEAAFIYATIIISLWNQFPEFGKLLLAHFYRQCPYLVPIYLPRVEGQSDADYYKSLGYEVDKDGTLENEPRFLERMSGILRLYFTLMISRPKRDQNTHPHNLTHAWIWLATILNMEPQPNITATALHIFLEVLGAAMEKTYGKQFKKVVHFIAVRYLGLITKCGKGGPAGRLEILLQKYHEDGRFEEPKGQLPANFW